MSRHPNRPCSTTVSSYQSHFFRDQPPQYQWLCEGCGDLTSGFLTEAAAEMAGLNHAGLGEITETETEEIDRITLLRAQQAAQADSLPDFVL